MAGEKRTFHREPAKNWAFPAAVDSNGNDGAPGQLGEVTNADLISAIAGTSTNSNGVSTLGLVASDPPTQGEVQLIAEELDELITALRRYGKERHLPSAWGERNLASPAP